MSAVTSARNALSITEGVLEVRPVGLDRLWSFRGRITIDLSQMKRVEVERDPHRVPSGWRGPGLDAFGKKSGTFHPGGERHYWNYSGNGPALMLETTGGRPFHRLYLSVEDADAALDWVSAAARLA